VRVRGAEDLGLHLTFAEPQLRATATRFIGDGNLAGVDRRTRFAGEGVCGPRRQQDHVSRHQQSWRVLADSEVGNACGHGVDDGVPVADPIHAPGARSSDPCPRTSPYTGDCQHLGQDIHDVTIRVVDTDAVTDFVWLTRWDRSLAFQSIVRATGGS
jgi:hypothetical protein